MAALGAFLDDQSAGLCHVDYWARVAEIWRDADAGERADERWRSVWEQARLAPGSQNGLMTAEERDVLAGLPDEVPLRAAEDVAFARRIAADGEPADRTVGRHRVVALLLVDGAPEVILEPDRA